MDALWLMCVSKGLVTRMASTRRQINFVVSYCVAN